jgi:hypothetical protein
MGLQRKEVSRYRSTVVIDNNGEPRIGGLAVWTDQQNIERRMIRLPDCVRARCLPPVDQLERIAVCLSAVMRESYEISGQAANNAANGSIAWGHLSKLSRKPHHLAVQRCDREGWLL